MRRGLWSFWLSLPGKVVPLISGQLRHGADLILTPLTHSGRCIEEVDDAANIRQVVMRVADDANSPGVTAGEL